MASRTLLAGVLALAAPGAAADLTKVERRIARWRKHVDSTNYTQTGVVKTIELVLGLPPMNQLDLCATPLRACFQDKPDLTPYAAVPNKVRLDEMSPPLRRLKGKALYWARKSLELDFAKEDRADEDTLNRILWHSARGYDTPYPRWVAGKRGAKE